MQPRPGSPPAPTTHPGPTRLSAEPLVRLLLAALGVAPVMALLAWGMRLGSFAAWFWLLGAPALLLLVVAGMVVARFRGGAAIRASLVAGAIGGLVGTIGYDAIRLPQLAFGLRPYLPIQSYGLLLLERSSSSPLTELAGWAFNLVNGIGFGIAYAVLARGRRWWWAVPYALALETAFVVTPLAGIYQLSGQWTLIGLAYVAHLFYAYPLGRIVQSTDAFVGELDALSPHVLPVTLAVLAAVLVAWHRPLSSSPPLRAAAALSTGARPGAVIVAGRFVPEWLRVPPGGCALLRDDDRVDYRLSGARGNPSIRSGQVERVCFDGSGVLRVRTSSRPYAGGIALVDPEMPG